MFQKVLEKTSKMELIRTFASLTPAKILNGNFPSIAKLARQYGKEQVEKVNAVLFADLSSSMDGDLDQEQISEICVELNSEFMLYNLTIEDIYYVCRQIKTSELYGKLTVNKVLKALRKHAEERTTLAITLNENEHLATKEPMDAGSRNNEVQQFKQQMRDAKTKLEIQNGTNNEKGNSPKSN